MRPNLEAGPALGPLLPPGELPGCPGAADGVTVIAEQFGSECLGLRS